MSDNIKVVVKVRPLISREIEEKLSYQWRVKNNTLYQLDQNGKDSGTYYTFDKVYDKDAKTTDVYNDIAKPIVEAATAGVNGTIFAYGQTSSGKTYTMTGTENSPGIIPLAVYNLFDIIKNIPDRDFLVRVSYIEIYNETLRDLLNTENKKIKIHETFQGVKVDASEPVTTSPEEVLKFLKEGEANRQTGATNMNEESSRSHSIFQITIESREHIEDEEEATGCVNVSQLNLVDLAGSERAGQTGATGIRFKEGTHINKSLSALALLIKQLSEDPNKFANYRNSKLTRILQNSLGGNAKTSIICAITPAALEETISTLQFANRAKAIKNKPEVNAVATDATMIQGLTKQLSRLQAQLEDKKNIEQEHYNLKQQMAKLQRLIINGFSQRSTQISNRRKNAQLRRVTISSLPAIEESPVPAIPKFCTPSLKYNPMSLPEMSGFMPIQNTNKLDSLPEETRLVTPPPNEKKVNFSDEVIDLDSDDDPADISCSPYHKCYVASKTPPCILRKNAKIAEQNLKDIVELTEREKIYAPNVNELLEKLQENTNVIAKLEDEVNALNKQSKEKDFEIDQLKVKISKSEEEIKTFIDNKMEMDALCKDYHTKLTDWEVSYETLKQKTKRREEELLSLLEEQKAFKRSEDIGKPLPRNVEKELAHFMNMSKDISLVNSDSESSIVNTNDDESSSQIQDLVMDLQNQLTAKNQLILELESKIFAQSQKVDSLEFSCKELQEMVQKYKDRLVQSENENSALKSMIDTLNSTIHNQKQNLETAKSDIESYTSLIQELHIKLSKKESNQIININESVLETMIANEEKFLANHENIKNIIQSFRLALNSRNKEIDILKSSKLCDTESVNNDSNLIEQLETKNKQIWDLTEEAQRLKEQINNNITEINKLTSEKKAFEHIEYELNGKLSDEKRRNEQLERLNKENSMLIERIKATNNQLTGTITENQIKEQELQNLNEKMTREIQILSEKIVLLENDIDCKDNLILSLKNRFGQNQEQLMKAKLSLQQLQNILFKLTGNVEELPDLIDDYATVFSILSNNLNILENIVTEIYTKMDSEANANSELRKELLTLNEKHTQEIETLQLQINSLQNNKEQNLITRENLEQNLDQAIKESNERLSELETVTKKYKELEETYSEALKKYDDIFSDNEAKESLIMSLQKGINTSNSEIVMLRQKNEKIQEIHQNEIEKLKISLTRKQVEFDATILEKESKISDLEKKIKEMESVIIERHAEISKCQKELKDSFEKRHQILNNILQRAIEVTNRFHLGENKSFLFGLNSEEQIVVILDKFDDYISFVNSNETKTMDNLSQEILEAKQEITSLTQENFKLMNDLKQVETRNKNILSELEIIQEENENLKIDLMDLLTSLQDELQFKVSEMENKKNEAFLNPEQSRQKLIESKVDLQVAVNDSDLNLVSQKSRESSHYSTADDLQTESATRKSLFNLTENILQTSPPSLLTICCNKIISSIQPAEKSVTTSSSNSSICVINQETQTNMCDCEKLSSDLATVYENNMKLTNTIKHLESVNQHLISERNDIRKEIELLIEPACELQKKVNNHKTNLSILTATTYAENKSLKSQVKSLQHHHTRFHMVCQRDIPAVKKQLHELMSILKKDSLFLDKENCNFKRFSLPDTLENNSILSNFKSDETTLDGDLLMLDTNITLTTSADNTLIGQNCLDITQTYQEVACQTNAPTENSDIIESQMKILLNDNQKMCKCLDVLKEENFKLREQIDKYTQISESKIDAVRSPLKINTINEQLPEQIDKDTQTNEYRIDAASSPLKIDTTNEHTSNSDKNVSECVMCKKYKYDEIENLKIKKELMEKVNSLSLDLSNIKKQKEHIENKYENLTLEIPTTEILIKKLSSLEKEKANELSKLSSCLNSKNLEIKRLQEENDSLSTQVMENISEVDDLNKELQEVKETYTKLMAKYADLQNSLEETKINNHTCVHCAAENDVTNSSSLPDASQSHTKLNRSLSESDKSSRFNKIFTLQNELHAGKEDCKELTEDVTTIKNHLECNTLSIEQNMDIDVSMNREPNIRKLNKDVDMVNSSKNILNMPNIPEEPTVDIYSLEKNDCLKYYFEITGTNISENEYINNDIKIIDLMKIFYKSVLSKHSNEVENLLNKLKCYEQSRKELEDHVNSLKAEYSEITEKLQQKDQQFKIVGNILSQIKSDLNVIKLKISDSNDDDLNTKAIFTFKENFLKVLDTEFDCASVNIFEYIIDTIVKTHESNLNEVVSLYENSQKQILSITAELNDVKEKIVQLQSQLADKQNEYNLLKAQKERVHEISNAVTLDIIKKERELNETIMEGYKQLVNNNILSPSDMDCSLPLNKKVNLLFDHFINRHKDLNLQSQIENLKQEINEMTKILESKDKEIKTLKVQNDKLQEINNSITLDLINKDNLMHIQKSLYEDLKVVYDSKVEENEANITLINTMTDEIKMLKDDICKKEAAILNLEKEIKTHDSNKISKKDEKIMELMNKITMLEKEIDNLKNINKIITIEKEENELSVQKSGEIIKQNKIELEKLTSDVLILKESVKDNLSEIENLKVEAKSLLQQNIELKQQFEEKSRDCARLEMNIKTHEKTAEIQSKMIIRLQKQKEKDNEKISESDEKIEQLSQKCNVLLRDYEIIQNDLKVSKEEIDILKNTKESLELRITELESELDELKPCPSFECNVNASRRRRQSLHDSQRALVDNKNESGDHVKTEAVFESRGKPEDLFMEVDDDSSDRSTPLRFSKGRESLASRGDMNEKEDEVSSRPNSVQAIRRKRQSSHDLQRSFVRNTPSPHDIPSRRPVDELNNIKSSDSADASSELSQLRVRLAACQEELEELKERYKELDEECETCSQYLREQEAKCAKLRKEKVSLEKIIIELREKLQSVNTERGVQEHKSTFVDVAVNTDEDWANLHSVVVDRMSYDAEVEKNKRLTRTVEELRFKKQELKTTISKMQKHLEKQSGKDKELEATKLKLEACKQELEEMRERYTELDEECEICAERLRESEKQYRQLKEVKTALEAKLQEYQEDHNSVLQSLRKRRQSMHDQNRGSIAEVRDASTETSDDFLSYQVERDGSTGQSSDEKSREIKTLRMTVDKLRQHKTELEQKLISISASNPLYVATGSAIVQNQQLTDVLKENQKLKKINAKLINICKKRGKEPNREYEEVSQQQS